MPRSLKYFFSGTLLFALTATAFAVHYQDSFKYRTATMKEGRGVVLYDRLRTADGYNLFIVFRRWKTRYCEIYDLSGKFVIELVGEYCHLLDDGSYVTSDHGIAKFDHNHQLMWRHENVEVHHDLNSDPSSGDVFAWSRAQNVVVRGKKIREDELIGFSSSGTRNFLWRSVDHLEDIDELYGEKVMPIVTVDHFTELTHFNSVQVIPENSLNLPAFRKGNLLVSCARCACMGVIDRNTGHFVWRYRATAKAIDQIHTARLLANGNILFFHNINPSDSSEVIEINPHTKETVWSYRSPVAGVFSAPWMGSSLRLDNGNTLVTHLADGGGAFELTSEGRIVWDWKNSVQDPLFEGEVYKVMRVPKKWVDPLVETQSKQPDFF